MARREILHRSSAKSGVGKWCCVVACVFVLALSMFVFAGCSCSSQTSASSSSASSASSSSASSAAQVQVPDLTGLKQADAEAKLKEVGLVLGTVTQENNDTVTEGLVVSQKPEAKANADSGSKVDLVVSKGKAAAQVAVPDLKGKSQADAEKALTDLKLVPVKGDSVETADVEAGLVYQQSVAAGTKVDEGTKVTYQLAAKQTVAVPDVVGKASADAKAELEKAGLKCETADAYSDTVAKDIVISQSVAANTKVEKDSVVALQISQGAKPAEPVTVPEIMGLKLADAERELSAVGLKCTYTGDQDGVVESANPAPGAKVDAGSTVALTLAKQPEVVVVPDVVGMTVVEAGAAMDKVGLVLSFDANDPNTATVLSTNPAAGATVDKGTVVDAVCSEPVNEWTPASSASAAAKGAGLDGFDVPGSVYLVGESFGVTGYAYRTGGAQATYEGPALMVIVRKAEGISFDELTADMGSYSKSWKQNFKGLEISCSGESKSAASIMKWKIGNTRYVAGCIGLGGETVGMDADEVSSLVAGIQ